VATVEFMRVCTADGPYLCLRGINGEGDNRLGLLLQEYQVIAGDIGVDRERRTRELAKLRKQIRKLGHGTAITRVLHRMRVRT